jgi:hypothetical protein
METVIIIVVIAIAASYTIRTLYRSASAGKKSCGCEDGCPISQRCNPDDGRCVVTEHPEKVAK